MNTKEQIIEAVEREVGSDEAFIETTIDAIYSAGYEIRPAEASTVSSAEPGWRGIEGDDLQSELAALLNKHSVENDSDTPDYILADFVLGCLEAFAKQVRNRDTWHGFKPWPDQKRELPAPPARGNDEREGE